MSARSRNKGARGERELIGLLRDRLGDVPGLYRNLDQPREGGADIELPGYAVEVKRCESFRSAWIDQAERQAGNDVPVIAWRRNGQPWRMLVCMTLDEFAQAVRESIS